MVAIQKIALPFPGMNELFAEAEQEGYDFVTTLVEEWASGANRFEGAGETLLGVVDEGRVIAVGGLTIDPFVPYTLSASGQVEVGRIRRVYVRAAWRNRGIGRVLVVALVEKAREGFTSVRLRAENSDAARLYERIGFSALDKVGDSPDATHILKF